MTPPQIVWLRRDLRLGDQAAFHAPATAGPVIWRSVALGADDKRPVDYPAKLIGHREARQRALDAYHTAKA